MGLAKWLCDWRREALPRINTRSLLSHYLPVTGAVSHTLYTIHYSVFAAIMFNFGSLLAAVFIKALFPSKYFALIYCSDNAHITVYQIL
uniref:Uncharacterized protein n=1 Tax=Parascaris equorum TaxID=6256 RepID=A0A914RVG6_PAREQ